MAALTLSDVVDRMKAEGQLSRNSGTNSLKSIKDILKEQTGVLKEEFNNLLVAVAAGDLMAAELKMEQDRYNERILAALEGMANDKDKPGAPDEDSFQDWMALGLIGTTLATTLGTALGAIKGQVAAIKAFTKLLTPEALAKSFRGMVAGFSMHMDLLKTWMGEKVAGIKGTISAGLTRLGSLFNFSGESRIGKVLAWVGSKISGFVDIFKTVGTLIKDTIMKPARIARDWFSIIGSYMASFGNTVARVAGVVGKIFAPIAILMTAYDTIVGAVEGFEKDGILGGIKGAIDGLFTSLITKPLDLLKDGVAWVLGKLGFDETSETLSSFSFTTLFTDMTKGIMDFIKGAWNFAINEIVETISNFDVMAVLGDLSNMGEEFLKDLIRAVLPPADALRFEIPKADLGFTEIGGGFVNLNPIPESVYEWAGQAAPTPSEPGATDPGTIPPQQPQTQLQPLEEATTELKESTDANTAAAMPSVSSVSSVDASTTVTSSTNQVYVGSEMDPYSRRSQEDDSWFGGWFK